MSRTARRVKVTNPMVVHTTTTPATTPVMVSKRPLSWATDSTCSRWTSPFSLISPGM